MKRVFRVKFKLNGKTQNVAVNSINMVQLVAALDKQDINFKAEFIGKV